VSRKWIIKDLLEVTARYFKEKEIDNPLLCAEILLALQLKCTRVRLYLDFDQPVSETDLTGYRALVKRRLNREPIQHITGIQEFRSMDFMVTPRVLIPRPETEILVEQALSICTVNEHDQKPSPAILDLGTGCGAIAVSLSKELSEASLWASDISGEALDLARLNAEKHGVDSRINFIEGDLFESFDDNALKFDVIVSNPPYIDVEEYTNLPPEVRDHEPRQALDGHEKGMFFIENIITQSPDYLKPGSWLLIEMDPRQTSKALSMIENNGSYGEKRCVKDYSQKERVVMARKK
jgi:release factor glutamine methyltransferase